MSLRQVLVDWIDGGLEPDGTVDLPPVDQRQLCADIFLSEPDWMWDALSETLGRVPQTRVELTEAFRSGDFLQAGAILDKVLRSYIIGSDWLISRLREVQEQESDYRESL